MKAAIVNPYWDTLGGGERYAASVVSVLLKKGYKVDIQWKDSKLINTVEKRFNLDLKGSKVVESVDRGDGYDLCFWVSDGSIPTLKSRNNILHFQIPFNNFEGRTLLNKTKLFRIKHVVCNSEFTKSFIDKTFGINSKVIYPPVDVKKIKPKRKENLILYVGRFSQLTQSKHQDILIDVFKKFYDRDKKDWKMVLAGGAEVGVGDYIKNLREMAKGYPIKIVESPSYKVLLDYFGKAKLFWSAAGYGVDEYKDPSKVEHFGISLVEAMSAKAVPAAVDKGGFKEIIDNNINGFLWSKKSELLENSLFIANNRKLFLEISKKAQLKSEKFSFEMFEKNIEKII